MKKFVLALLAISCMLPASSFAAYEFYVTIDGAKQGKFRGESMRDAHKAKIAGLSFNYEVLVPRDANTGPLTGRRIHKPVSFIKEWGVASPQIFQALVTNEPIRSVFFEFLRTNSTGSEEVYQTIRLSNASITSFKRYAGNLDGSAKPATPGISSAALEEVTFTFQKIEIEDRMGKTSASDDATMK